MGMFDTVHFVCPKCNVKFTDQTKNARHPNDSNYHQNSVPAGAAAGFEDMLITCPNEHTFKAIMFPQRVRLTLVSAHKDEYGDLIEDESEYD